MAGIQVDGANQKLVLDSDGDTYLEAATDDTIKVYVAGAHDATISANAINVLSGTTLTIDSGATITNSGTANGFGSNEPSSADGQALGSASAEWSDLFLADGGIIKFGNDQDVLLTHVADTGLLLNGTNVIQFNDASQNIGAPSNAILDINATDEIELNATLLDVNANLDVSGTYTGAGLMTTGGNIVIPDAGTIGSASDTDAIAIASDGDVTFSQKIGVITAHDLGSGIHVRTADSGAAVDGAGDELVVENNGPAGISILSANDSTGNIFFGDDGSNQIGFMQYNHDANSFRMYTNGAETFKVNSNGAVTHPLQPAFLVTKSGSQSNVAINATTTITFDTERFDVNADFASNTFTAPVTGKYQFNFTVNWGAWDADFGYVYILLVASNRTIYAHLGSGNQVDADGYFVQTGSALIDMDTNDTIALKVQISDAGAAQADISQSSWFSGYLAC
jgi:Tfp pilus assembly protein FimT